MQDWGPRDGVIIGVPLILLGLFVVLQAIPLAMAPAAIAGFWALVGLYIWIGKRKAALGLVVVALAGVALWWTLAGPSA